MSMTEDEKPPNLLAEEREALDRIARTPDGHLLHRYLRRVLEAVFDTPPRGALRALNGRRSLARDLMREMAQGIEESRRVGSRESGPAERPVLTRAAQPVRIGGRSEPFRAHALRTDPELAGAGGDDPSAA